MLAFKVYNAANIHNKCMMYLMKSGNIDGMTKYVQRFPDYHADYAEIIASGLSMGVGLAAEAIEKMKNFANSVIGAMNYQTDYQQIENICESFSKYGYT